MTDSAFSRFKLLKRLPIIFLVVGPALLYFAWLGPRASRDHAVVFRFEQPLHNVRRLTATWTDSQGNGDPLAGATFDVPSASEPREFRTNVHVPDGDFWVDLELEGPEGTQAVRRRIQLGDGETTIILPIPAAAQP